MSTIPPSAGQPQAPLPATIVPEPRNAQPRPKSSFWRRFFLVVFVLVFAGSVLFNLLLLPLAGLGALSALEAQHKIHERHFSHNREATDKVAIITVEGVILDAEDGFVKRQIDRVLADKEVKAVVLRINSPGGSVSVSDYLHHHLRRLAELEKRQIPMVVSMGGMAASGGYYLAMAAHPADENDTRIYAEPTTFTGSIGVIIPHYSLEGLMEWYGVEQDSVVSRPLKGMGTLTRKINPEERKLFQALVDDSFDRFKGIIRAGRPYFQKNPAELEKVATGQIYSADQAKKNHLVDEIGFIEDAVKRAIKLANLDEKEVHVIKYEAKPGLGAALLGGQTRSQPTMDLSTLLDMTTPRAFYLCTWLPGLNTGKP